MTRYIIRDDPFALARIARSAGWKSEVISAREGGFNAAYANARQRLESQGWSVVTFSEWQADLAHPGTYRALVYFTKPRTPQDDQP